MANRKRKRGGRQQPPSQFSRNNPVTREDLELIPDPTQSPEPITDFTTFERLPITYQDLNDLAGKGQPVNLFALRHETFRRIEKITGVPLICYVAQTSHVAQGVLAHIEDSDLVGFDDLVQTTDGPAIDVFIVSNGGSAEATERIVKLLRGRFSTVRFIISANAYSAATMMCLSGDEILMSSAGTLGPIDPQISGIPTRAILRAFDQVKEQLKIEGPKALTAYTPLLSKYDLHMLEMCKSAEELSKELAGTWLSTYMLKVDQGNEDLERIVKWLTNYDEHKSHSRGIDRAAALDLGLKVRKTEEFGVLDELVRSLRNQYALFIDQTPFYKLFENARGINWGRQSTEVTIQLPQGMVPISPQPAPQPGPPRRAD